MEDFTKRVVSARRPFVAGFAHFEPKEAQDKDRFFPKLGKVCNTRQSGDYATS